MIVSFVGTGPGDPRLITRRGHDLIAAADVVVADRRSSAAFVAMAPAGAERVFVGRTPAGSAWPLAAIVDLLADRVGRGARVVRLKSGDPFVCARTSEEIEALAAVGVESRVVPGVTAATAAPAAAGVPVIVPGLADAVTIVAGNDDPVYPAVDWDALARRGTLVVLMGRGHQGRIAERLLAAGVDSAMPVAVIHAATRPGELVRRGTLADLSGLRVPPPATIVVGPAAALDLRASSREVLGAHP